MLESVQQCPINHSEDMIKKAGKTRGVFAKIAFSPVQCIKNTYYFRDDISCYDYIGQLIQEKSCVGKYKDVYTAPTLAGSLNFVTEPEIMKALLKIPRLAHGELLNEGRQLRVIAQALGAFRLNKDKEDLKPKRNVLGELLMHPEKYLQVLQHEAEVVVRRWQKQQTPIIITKDVSEMTVALFLKSVRLCCLTPLAVLFTEI